MSKILDAQCQAGVVSIEGFAQTDVTILSKGVGPSTGKALVEGDQVTYVTSSATDIEALITNVKALLDQVIIVLTSLDSVTVSPGSAAASITALNLLVTQFELTKEQLK